MQGRDISEKRYRQFRRLSYTPVMENHPVRLTEITASALDYWGMVWRQQHLKTTGWPWPGLAEHYRRKYPERFDLALWSGEILCGLCLGKPSGARSHLSLEYLEANPDPSHPLKGRILDLTLAAADNYAMATGCRRIRLVEPEADLIPRYEAAGFRLVRPRAGQPYLESEVPRHEGR